MLSLQLQQVIEEKDGAYTVVVNAIRDDGKVVVKGKTFQAKNVADLKAVIKPLFERLIAIEKRKDAIRDIAQNALDEITREVTQ